MNSRMAWATELDPVSTAAAKIFEPINYSIRLGYHIKPYKTA